MAEWYHCVGCGRLLPADEIGITGRCKACWEEYRKEHDTLLKTIAWRELVQRRELPEVGR